MKLFIVAALVAVCSAGRLEHLERSYLPPDSSNSVGFGANGRSQNGFGSNGQGIHGFGSQGSSGDSFGSGSNGGSHGAFGSNGGSDAGFRSIGNGLGSSNGNGFGAATSNQYLPPNYSSAGSNGFARSGSSSFRAPNTQYGTTSFGNNNGFGGQGGSQYSQNAGQHAQGRTQPGAGLSNQYLAPARSNSFQNIPQQSFDEQSGYHY
ncbi:pupal cuticle protein 36 [Papilio machaon]|uniref:pupal cuticle protein 36 n=1 Tax=Papilio machaon TaxID=76193 RepID=UPI001E662AA2|nr:pupal cuticle protein 36 [Papilio machaon]